MDLDYAQGDHGFRKHDAYAQSKYNLTARWLRRSPERGSLFHVGCGGGLFNQVAVDLGFHVTAYEPDPSAFRMAASDCPAGCTVYNFGLEQIAGDSVADVIVMHDVLEHIADETGAVRALARLLRPGGRLVLSVPALNALFGYHDEQLGHYRRYRRRTLRAALEPTFRISRMRYFGFFFLPVTLVFSRLLRRPYPTRAITAERSALGHAFNTLCGLEERMVFPIGTSLICDATVQ